MQRLVFFLAATLVLASGFLIISASLEQDSLWADEGWTLWAVGEPGWRGAISTVQRVAADVHPPLYFLLIDSWIGIAGDSVYALRLFSALCALLALAAAAGIGRRMFNARAGLIAAALLGTAPFVVYYGREARMYALLLALAALSTWAYVGTQLESENRKRSTGAKPQKRILGNTRIAALRRGVFSLGSLYILFSAALVYTHYAGWLILLAHGLQTLLTRRRVFAWLLRMGVIGGLFAPWGLVWLRQIQTQGVPTASPLPTNLDTLNTLLLVLTNGAPLLFAAPFVLALVKQLSAQRTAKSNTLQWRKFSLLLLWLIVPPVVLLLLNAFRPPLFQMRYMIGALPAGALLLAWALEQGLRTAEKRQKLNTVSFTPWRLISLLLLLVMLWLHVTQYRLYWPEKPRWNQAAAQYGAARHALHPAITIIPPQSPLAYYDVQMGLRRGITLDLAWRWHEPDEMRTFVEMLSNADSIWLVSPANDARTWDAAAALVSAGRQIGYRDSVMATIFYRFDRTQNDTGNFNFYFTTGGSDAPLFAYGGGLGVQLYAQRGEPFCFDLPLIQQREDGQLYHLQVHLTQGQGTLRAGADVPLGDLSAAPLSACVPIPADAPAGTYHLRIAILNSATDQRLYLVEGADALYWGYQLLIGWVSVE